MHGTCSHCFCFKKVTIVGSWTLCDSHKELKQYSIKKKAPGGLKRTALKKGRSPKKQKEEEEIKEIMKRLPALCTGCTCSDQVEPSHLIPRSQSALLITFPLNIRPHCRDCHTLWEHKLPGVENMNDYNDNLDRIKTMDLTFYNRLMNK
jgi:hypothetical protein